MIFYKTFFDAKERIWRGQKNVLPLYHPDLSIGQAILQILKLNPTKIAQISANNDFKITNKQMVTLSIRTAQNIQRYGLQQNEIIGIIANNSQYLAPILFGAMLYGTPINSLDPTFGKDEIKQMYSITRPKIIICDSEKYTDVKNCVNEIDLNCKIFIIAGEVAGVDGVNEFFKGNDDEDDFVAPRLENGGEQTAAILCSSGTTGAPKGVCLSHHAVLSSTMIDFISDDVTLCFSTIYWLSGFFMLVHPTLSGCTRVIIDEPFSVDKCFDIIEKYHVSVMLAPPAQLTRLVQSHQIGTRNLSSIKTYFVGGSAVNPDVKLKMNEYLKNGKVLIGYGMTEICGACTIEKFDKQKYGSVGQLGRNIEVRVIDENGENLGIDEAGELLIRPNFKWNGYYGNPEATALTLDSDGWIHSGDMGYFDSDGYVFIVDRKKDILKYNNYHFFPTEIEIVIAEIDGVAEVCVCGIPDLIVTDLPAAAIVKKKNANLTEQDVCEYVSKRLAHYKNLYGGVYFVDNLPQTASGKVQRNKVKEMLIKLREHAD